MVDQQFRAYDTYVNQAAPDHNYADTAKIRLSNLAANNKLGYIQFPLQLPTDATVVSATLTLYLRSAWTGSNTITATRVTQKWREGHATYSNRASVGVATATVGVTGGVDRQAASLDMTALVQLIVAGGFNYGWRLSVGTSGDRDLYSSEYADSSVRPILTVSYVLPPDAPRNLRADGSRAVSFNKPLLLWDADTPAQVKIELDNNSDFTSLLWNPGYVAQTENEYDPAALTALTDNTQYYWRVRIKDANSVESEWSDAADFYYRSLGTPSISAPAGSTATTNRPTFTHALAGRTQAYTSYALTEDGALVYARSKLATLATSFQVPAGYVRDPSASYVMTIRIWDNFDREVVGTAKDYAEVSKTFTLTTGATTAPTTMDATQVAGHVHLTWSRATTPDAFTIEVDGVAVFDELDPVDVSTGGTGYALDYYRAEPKQTASTTFGVKAEVAGVLSTASTDTLTFAPVGIWLADEDTGAEVNIIGKDPVSSAIGESGATFFPIGSRTPVRIVDSIRGFEGDVSGELLTWGSQTVASNRDDFEYIKGHPDASLRLVYGHRNIPVIIGSARMELTDVGEESYAVGFEFWQTAEYSIDT